MMKWQVIVCIAVVTAMIGGRARAADSAEDLAQAAADAWLKLTDAGDGGASWDQAAKAFQSAVSKAQWTQALAGVRPPLGKLLSRKVTSRRYTEQVPGAPAGKYVIIQYETAFEHKAQAVETVTPMLDADGVWRVSGYFIR
jgi:hypothetical protein